MERLSPGRSNRRPKSREREFHAIPGFFMVFFELVFLAIAAGSFITAVKLSDRYSPATPPGWYIVAGCVFVILFVLFLIGFFIVNPNESRVLVLFGKYRGTVRKNGFFWTNPFTAKSLISLRIRNYDGEKLKVNDSNGNPIEISAVVVWRVEDTAQAVFDVDDYIHYVKIQSESALRQLASEYPYDAHDDNITSLRGSTDDVCGELKKSIEERLDDAGVEVLEARLNHLAYAPEIAAAMLQRQQADAIIAARQKIVDGAVGMVQMALDKLRQDGVIELDEARKAAMVSNLLVVLCGDASPTPVINTGSSS